MNGGTHITFPSSGRDPQGCVRGCLIMIAALQVILIICLCFQSCKSMPAVVAPQVHNGYDGHNRDNLSRKRDSIYIHDSIIIREMGDTVFIYKERIHDRWLTNVDSIHVRDSIHIRDSVPYPVEVVKSVPVRNGYTRFTSWFFWIVLVAVLLWAAWKICDRLPVTSRYTAAVRAIFKIGRLFR